MMGFMTSPAPAAAADAGCRSSCGSSLWGGGATISHESLHVGSNGSRSSFCNLGGVGGKGNGCGDRIDMSLLKRRNVWVRGFANTCGGFGFLSQGWKSASFMSLRWTLGVEKLGQMKGIIVRCGRDDDSVDENIPKPPYTSYIDPNTGEPSPTFGARTPFPDETFWSEDMVRLKKSGQASTPANVTKESPPQSSRARDYVSNRRRTNEAKRRGANTEGLDGIEEAETLQDEGPTSRGGTKLWYAKNDPEHDPIIAAYNDTLEEEEEDEEKVGAVGNEVEDGDEEDKEVGIRPESGLARKEDASIVPASSAPLGNEELWWNWKKPAKGEEPWSAWHKRPGDSDTVMAAAMAETGQIKLFGEKPSIAEATLARARKLVFYEQRMKAEEQQRVKKGSVAYYQEWVKNWRQDTSKEAIDEHKNETGEGVPDQLLDMFQHQTRREYRQMMGTDIRIRRDPLTMRMREELKKQVWGGDPVYPTINYVQDPDCVADYRNANLHEPTPDIIETLRESGRLITQEEIQALQAMEKAQELEVGFFDDGMTGAIDIGDKEEDEDEDDEDNAEEDSKMETTNQQQVSPRNSKVAGKQSPVIGVDRIDTSELVELVENEDEEDEEEEGSGPVEEQEE